MTVRSSNQKGDGVMRTARTTAGTVAYEDIGTGRPIVLLHANMHDHHDFDPIVPALAREHRVIAIDWPGHGASQANPELTGTMVADTLADIVTALELEPAVYIGNSIGGYAAARLAIDHPQRVAGLVLVNTGGFVAQSVLTRAYCRFFGSSLVARSLLPQVVRFYTQPISTHDRTTIASAIRTARTETGRATYQSLWRSFNDPAYDLTGSAATITAPTMVVWGSHDPLVPVRYGRATAAAIPGARLETLPTGHMPFSSLPQQFLNIVEPFIHSALTTI